MLYEGLFYWIPYIHSIRTFSVQITKTRSVVTYFIAVTHCFLKTHSVLNDSIEKMIL